MQRYLKALYGAAAAGLGAAATAYAQGGNHISGQSYFFIAITTLGALAVVFGVPNNTKTGAKP